MSTRAQFLATGEAALGKYNYQARHYLEDLQGFTSGTGENLLTIPAGAVVREVLVKTITALAGAGPLTAATGQIGVTGTLEKYITALNWDLFAAGDTYVLWDETAPDLFTTANLMIVEYTLTGGTCAQLTAGEVIVFADMVNINDLFRA